MTGPECARLSAQTTDEKGSTCIFDVAVHVRSHGLRHGLPSRSLLTCVMGAAPASRHPHQACASRALMPADVSHEPHL